MLECLPWLGFVGAGLYCLLTALVPAWRDQNWNRLRFHGFAHFNHASNPNPWLVQLGLDWQRKPAFKADFDEKSAVFVYYALAAFFLLIGIGGLILIVYRSIV